jgi:hypothetical protein
MAVRVSSLLLLMVGFARGALADGPGLVGYWNGRAYWPAWRQEFEYIDHYAADGYFEARFRFYDGCKVVGKQWLTGTWSTPDDATVRVVVTSVDGEPVEPSTDDYHTWELTEQLYRYISIRTGVPYTSHRVDANFVFRECDLTS